MSNDLQNNNAVAALAGLRRGIQNVKQALPTSSTEPILRMGKDGVWVYGQENLEVEEDSRWAANPMGVKHGFVCWTNYSEESKKKNELKGEVYASMMSEPIDPTKLPQYLDDNGNPWDWKAASTIQLVCMDGEDKDAEVIYKPSSVGGGNCMEKLLTEVEKQLDAGSDQIVPIVIMECDSYKHAKYGKTYVPEFNVVDWMSIEGPAEAEEPAQVEAPKKKKKAAKKPAPETTAEPDELDDVEEADAEVIDEPAQEEAPATEGRTRRRRRSA